MSPNFTACAADFKEHYNDTYSNFSYHGAVRGIFDGTARPAALITLFGCRKLCGTGSDYYPWADSSSTITTWVLPVVGLLLQAPYQSNEFRRTVYALVRWVGSPIASLSYILWNIKITGKCALMVDMATRYEDLPDEDSQFAEIRDSLFILSVMNQYSVKLMMPAVEAEKLLRIALFSDSLRLAPVEDETRSLVKRRQKLAKSIREGRRRGVVPVFISIMWFLFSLAISIQQAFGHLGDDATAHNLALGLLLGWLPVLILSSIVDRNPAAAEDVRLKFNSLLDDVRIALLNPSLRDTYMRDTRRTPQDFAWTSQLSNEDYFRNDFFTQFSGQGRTRWHYGCANSILAGIEDTFIADYGRDWLNDAERARTEMVLGPKIISGLRYFDAREIWQIVSSIAIVGGSVGGAFVLSYWTPTVGLGCRSGGYMVFMTIALGLFGLEMFFWWLIAEGSLSSEDLISRFGTNLERKLSRAESNEWVAVQIRRLVSWWKNTNTRDRIEALILRPAEVVNSAWLAYIVLAQTFGIYVNCRCMASVWGGRGGYLDFESYAYYRGHGVTYYWGIGTALSLLVMTVPIIFIVVEWCTQSHLSTEDYGKASRGLKRTRGWKRHTLWIRNISNDIITTSKHAWSLASRGKTRPSRRSLVWAAKTKPSKRSTVTLNTHGPFASQLENEEEALLATSQRKDSGSYSLHRLQSPPETFTRSPRTSFSDGSPRPQWSPHWGAL